MKVLIRAFAAIAVAFTVSAAPALAKPDPKKMKPFIDNLMKRMTLEEKVGQLVQYSADMSTTGATVRPDYERDIKQGMVGSMFNAYTPEFTRKLQRLAVEETRLKIPLLFAFDVIHGHRTVFPIPLGESATWDLKLIQKAARVSATEAAADGLHWTFAPMVDISRDPRWGRISEGAGEDPWLGSRIAEARVRGIQGNDFSRTDSVLACVKHFAAYGAPQGGRDYNIVDMSQRELFETYLPPYRAAVKAGAATVMTSFNEISGVPSSSNGWLLNGLLRKRWGFDGFVVTDYTAVNELIQHGVAEDDRQAGYLAFRAGVDMDMQGGIFAKHIAQLVKEGKVTRARLDMSVRRILEAKYKLGLFADPYIRSDEARAAKVLMSPEHLQIARQVARRSIVLLKNDGSVLPLKKSGTIALIGPMADNKRDQIGNWSGAGDWNQAVSLLEGMKANLGDRAQLLHAKGANLLEDRKLVQFLNFHAGHIEIDSRTPGEMIREAVETANKADVVVVALGETQGMSGEAASRTEVRVPENQLDLLRALHATGKPIVLVLYNGRPLALVKEKELSHAMLETWFLGTQAGHAIADVLLGDYNPSGKLPVTFPVNEGQIPVYLGQKNTGRPQDPNNKYTSGYLDAPNEGLFPFGYGMSYTTFEYSNLALSKTTVTPADKLLVRISLKNTGSRDGEEVVQLYIRDLVASVTRPTKQLRDFKKVFLKAGESTTVTLRLSYEDLKFYDENMKWIAEPGTFEVMVGGNSVDVLKARFKLVGGK